MRIAFISTILTYPWGGADTLWTSAAEAAVARGDLVLLVISKIAASHARVAALVELGATLLVRPAPEIPTSFLQRAWHKRPWQASRSEVLAAGVRAFEPDLLVFSCGGTYDLSVDPEFADLLKARGTPYRVIANFQYEHPALEEADRQRAREILEAADRVFFVSPRNLEITRLHLQSPLLNADCVHNPLAPALSPPWAPPQPWSLACVARLDPVKGLDLLLPALGAALGDTPGWQLNIYGRGSQRGYLETCARHCELSDRVNFRGFEPDLHQIWAQNHILVSPAVDEGVPMTIPEAMLRGRAVLATRVGGATEWIEHRKNGFICPAPTVDLLSDSLREAWSERLRWQEMGEAAAISARTHYRPDDFKKLLA